MIWNGYSSCTNLNSVYHNLGEMGAELKVFVQKPLTLLHLLYSDLE